METNKNYILIYYMSDGYGTQTRYFETQQEMLAYMKEGDITHPDLCAQIGQRYIVKPIKVIEDFELEFDSLTNTINHTINS